MSPDKPSTPSADHPAMLVWRLIYRIVLGVIGSLILLLGIVMLVTPGPAVLLIPTGLAILASQFPIVRKYLRMARFKLRGPLARFRRLFKKNP